MRLNIDYMDLDPLLEKLQEILPHGEKLTRTDVKQFKAVFFRLAEISNNGWISVKDRLPDDASDVLAYYDDSECEIRIAPVNYYKGVWYDCVFNRPLDTLGQQKITHWMPFPEPPMEVKPE